MLEKRMYIKPKTAALTENVTSAIPGALWGAALMVGRAVAAAMKGGINMTVGTDYPKTLQGRK